MDVTLACELDGVFTRCTDAMIRTQSWREDAKQDVWVHVLQKWSRFSHLKGAELKSTLWVVCRNFVTTWIGEKRKEFLSLIPYGNVEQPQSMALVDWDDVWSTLNAPALFVAKEWLYGGCAAEMARKRSENLKRVTVTMQDVAESLGMSRATVSRHLASFREAVEVCTYSL